MKAQKTRKKKLPGKVTRFTKNSNIDNINVLDIYTSKIFFVFLFLFTTFPPKEDKTLISLV